jgi:hypothetical protein
MLRKLKNLASRATIICLIVALATVVVPTNTLRAGSLDGRATFGQQLKQTLGINVSAAANTAAAASGALTAGATINLFAKENLLDGIAWAIAKQMASNVTRSLINWINSGFQGSPSFITDFRQFLLDSLDQVAGEYIKSLGGIGEFICSPFQLDVQAALSINYAQARSGMPSGPNQNLCTLTGIGSNIENFLSGTVDSWDQWLEVTSNTQNLPYGAYLAAESSLNIRLRNEAGQQVEVAGWGNGFLSQKVCNAIEGTDRKDCKITTPGQVISEALTFNLSIGQRTLIEADEINELIGALVNQLVLQVVQGLNGLLGLSEKGADGRSYLDKMVDEGVDLIDYTPYKKEMDEALMREVAMLRLIEAALSATSTARDAEPAKIRELTVDANRELARVTTNLSSLTVLIQRYNTATATAAAIVASSTATTTPRIGTSTTATSTTNKATSTADRINTVANSIRQEVVLDFLSLRSEGNLTTEAIKESKRVEWQTILYPYGDKKLE